MTASKVQVEYASRIALAAIEKLLDKRAVRLIDYGEEDGGRVALTLRIPQPLYERLSTYASKKEASRNNCIVNAIDQAVQ